MPTGDSNLVKSMLSWVSMLLHEHCQNEEEAAKNKHLKHWMIVSSRSEAKAFPGSRTFG